MNDQSKILLVDDRGENLLALEALLDCRDSQILKAESGKRALELLTEHDIALALIDVQMPELGGFELAELMRGLERTREVPIIFVTAGLHERARLFRGYETGAVDFMVKPLEPIVLLSKVGALLQLHQQKRLLAQRVTELETALSALKSERDRSAWLARLPEENPDPVVRLANDGTVLYANPSARTVCQSWKLEVGRPLESELAEAARQVLAKGEPSNTEVTCGERILWVAMNPAGDEVSLYFRDVTARKHSEIFSRALNSINQLIHSTRHFTAIMQGAIEEAAEALGAETAAVSLRRDGRWIVSYVLGLPREMVGETMSDEEERHALLALAQGCPVAIGDVLTDSRVDGERLMHWGIRAVLVIPLLVRGEPTGAAFFNFHKTPVTFGDAHLDFGVKLASAMSLALENARLFAEIEQSERELRDADRRKNEFLAVLSHELRNPLAPIKNSLFILDRTAPGGEQARRAKEVIDRQVNQLANLINDLLDMTRITSSKINLQRSRLELNELVRRAIEDNRSLFERRGVHLELEVASSPLFVHADSTRLAQVIGNLLQNAAKFTNQGGLTRVSVSVFQREASVRVADTGVGMKAETLARLFQPFMQAEHSLDRSKGGLGLGLALVKGLVELHGGRVAATSDGLGRGTAFTIHLPVDASSTLAPPSVAISPPTLTRCRVLIIEDNVDAADTLREVLEIGKHTVEVAYNGPDGVVKARAFMPDVILCDIGLPGMDGYEVAREIRKDESLKRVYLVALSGYALPDDLQRAAEAGFHRHLAKPPRFSKLEELLNELEPRQS